jgi:hypothetical protein
MIGGPDVHFAPFPRNTNCSVTTALHPFHFSPSHLCPLQLRVSFQEVGHKCLVALRVWTKRSDVLEECGCIPFAFIQVTVKIRKRDLDEDLYWTKERKESISVTGCRQRVTSGVDVSNPPFALIAASPRNVMLQVLAAVLQMLVIRAVTPSRLVGRYQTFGGIYRLHLQGLPSATSVTCERPVLYLLFVFFSIISGLIFFCIGAFRPLSFIPSCFTVLDWLGN